MRSKRARCVFSAASRGSTRPPREEREPLRYLAGPAGVSGAAAGVDLRRSGDQLEVYVARGFVVVEPLRAARVASTRAEADYVLLRYAPDLDRSAVKPTAGEVVVAVDTSASGDEAERSLRTDIAEAVVRALSSGDRFALVTVDLTPRVVYPPRGLAPATEAEVGRALEQLAAVVRGGGRGPPTWGRCSTSRCSGCTAPRSRRWSTSATVCPRWASSTLRPWPNA